eukprot:TRINITY_DN30140_c0_g1_i2.p1 TRINITY_DN30140_c0_g1~~TRINITY_DN30140_c0_g1_i2.p1  ORF type:complete len:311 (-),score=53.49 TRINITY_DN30140_c0_g1_i2:78-1010(-)
MIIFQGEVVRETSPFGFKGRRSASPGLQAAKRNHTLSRSSSAVLPLYASSLFKGPEGQMPLGKDLVMKTVRPPQGSFTNKPIFASSGWVRVSPPGPVRLRRATSQPAPETNQPAPEVSEEPIPVDDPTPEENGVELTGFEVEVDHLNGYFMPKGQKVNDRQIYSQGEESMWYHRGAWRIGVLSGDYSRCNAFVKTEAQSPDQIENSATWMASATAGDPDESDDFKPQASFKPQVKFAPQLNARAIKMALDSVFKKENTAPVVAVSPSGSDAASLRLSHDGSRLTSLLAEHSKQAHIEVVPDDPATSPSRR